MTFKILQESLCKRLWKEMRNGGLTGTEVAASAGLQQAHISNFLNGKRGLSLEAMDRVLAARKLSVLDLIDPKEINERASVPQSQESEFQNIPVVHSGLAASRAQISRKGVREILKFPCSFLGRLRSSGDRVRAQWERFVAMRIDAREGMSMFPRLLPGATVLIDRHYNSLRPYRRGEQTMFMVRSGKQCVIRYMERLDEGIILRPHNPAYPVEMLEVIGGHAISESVIGRIAHIGVET
jgi:transcriptional regulator with XRE-family HTH domain